MLTQTKNVAKKLKVVGTSPIRPDGVPKVTGLAQYGADYSLPGMLWAKVLRSPHAHANIRSINTAKALALPGVKCIITGPDLPEQKFGYQGPDRVAVNYWHMTRNILAREKVLYEGHAVAAVAATTQEIAEQALGLIEVDYEVLPHVIDVDEAMAENAPLLFPDMITRDVEPVPTKPSNIAKRTEFSIGDLAAGFASADEIVEMSFKTAPVHQGYIEPHACLARYGADGQAELWSSSQGHFVVRGYTAKLLNINLANLLVHPAEIGGGFGGKTVVYVEPIALELSRRAGHPVKLQMSREDVFKATGPTSGASMTVKIGVKKDGTIVAADGLFKFQAGAFPGSPVINATMCSFAPYEIPNVRSVGYDVVCNRPKSAAYRAPGSPISAFAVESVLDVLAHKIGMDPIKLRLKNAVKAGSPTSWGPKHSHDGYAETLKALLDHPEYNKPLGKNQGRGVASGYWFNGGGESTASVHINEDGSVAIATGSMDVGGSRASMALMAAETLGINYEDVRSTVADTATIGYNHVTGGSRVTFATGKVVVEACEKIIDELRLRAALMWDVDVTGVIWEDGYAKPADKSVGDFAPLSLKEIAAKKAVTGGPIGVEASINASGMAPGFASQFADVEVDPETGAVKILRIVCAQDVGRAIHPKYVQGQIHGGVAQGIGWALNEEYIYDKNGRLANAGFLDYRIPVASDLPMIEALIVEVPNPNHPYGVKGVGEANIVPPMAAIANAIKAATGCRLTELPMSPPRVLAAIDAHNGR
ncbi:xanthine dehydrogenase family protein molybdopterin-binding subunit [Orrella sp. NBD-18]|uniref:Xanthine dehydrogenase family protein molybdopterin-binding subunit n=1 Tax=Sheuella amnicola TaxID=2707330 RepID=A0A6B2R1L1_9BURK|nr:xanthine dehydrogenase family protein molybdopterin-binding subunit [Sheuella amnicola]NDY83993.1 xanthine dehydrogenase family protein molybdopterin-binding subunit [Sheuella amnicola]HBI83816.1 oxidoreductase [Alcaligenaceae bacterium]